MRSHCATIIGLAAIWTAGTSTTWAGNPDVKDEPLVTTYCAGDLFHESGKRMSLIEFGGFKGIGVDFGVGLNTVGMPAGREFGMEVDRSFTEVVLDARVRFDLPQRWKARIGAEYHLRDYATNVRADASYLDHRDNLWTTGVEVGRKFGNRLYVALRAGYGRGDLNDRDPTDRADEVGYTKYRIGVTAEWTF